MSRNPRTLPAWILPLAGTVLLALYISMPEVQERVLGLLFPSTRTYTHSRLHLLQMSLDHLIITTLATGISFLIGLGLGILVTRRAGKDFLNLVTRLSALVQTLPPSAVIILAFPFLGFGWAPTLAALFLYSLFPVMGNTILGFQTVDPGVMDAARGLGMAEAQALRIVEFPMASPYILTGLRHAFILNLATAAIGAVIGAGGLGVIIMSGLTLQNSALVFSGTLVITGFALLGEYLFGLIPTPRPPQGQSPP